MKSTLTDGYIQAELRQYGYEAASSYCEMVRTYVGHLLRWNRKVSLTTVTASREILRFHFGESLFAIAAEGVGRLADEGRLADVGSGAGFPGVPLAMALPEVDVTLIESNSRKAAFLAELTRSLGLYNLHVHHGRAEVMAAHESFGIITARAVGRYAEFLSWAETHVTALGRVVLWLGAEERDEVIKMAGWTWSHPIKIPRTSGRFIVAGCLPSATPG